MTPTATDELPADLVERVKQLSPRGKEQLLDLLEGDVDLPPDPRTDEEWREEIARRIADVQAGRGELLTREQAEEQVREEMRKLGVEL
jgi:putative addiction module component (TIGR02574 family)